MLKGVFPATKKDGTIYYRTSINYSGKHISLGSFASEEMAHLAYKEASQTLSDAVITIDNVYSHKNILPHEKIIILLNFRDNGLYFKNPIYLRKGYFSYFLSEHEELKFDIDDLFYYSSHKILKRQGHLYVNDYGMQITILNRNAVFHSFTLWDPSIRGCRKRLSVCKWRFLRLSLCQYSCDQSFSRCLASYRERDHKISHNDPHQWQLSCRHLFQ